MATCPRHPEARATDLCVVCGEAVCGECAFVRADQQVACPTCRGRLPPAPVASTAGPSRPAPGRVVRQALAREGRAKTTSPLPAVFIALSFFGCFCLPLALVGVVLALRELSRISSGKAAGGRNRTLAIVSLVLNLLAGVFNLVAVLSR